MSVAQLHYKYTSCLFTSDRAWRNHLRKWRDEDLLRTPVHWIYKVPEGSASIECCGFLYREFSVMRLIYNRRREDGFCNRIFVANIPEIAKFLPEPVQRNLVTVERYAPKCPRS